VTSMTVFSGAAWGSSTGSVAGRVPGVRANSLISCASARLTGWSRGMGVKPVALALAGAPPGQRSPAAWRPWRRRLLNQRGPLNRPGVLVLWAGLNVWSGQP
jgi:hypothetical protein